MLKDTKDIKDIKDIKETQVLEVKEVKESDLLKELEEFQKREKEIKDNIFPVKVYKNNKEKLVKGKSIARARRLGVKFDELITNDFGYIVAVKYH